MQESQDVMESIKEQMDNLKDLFADKNEEIRKRNWEKIEKFEEISKIS